MPSFVDPFKDIEKVDSCTNKDCNYSAYCCDCQQSHEFSSSFYVHSGILNKWLKTRSDRLPFLTLSLFTVIFNSIFSIDKQLVYFVINKRIDRLVDI